MAWIPTRGKAWLATQLEHEVPLEISIGAMRYAFWNGLLLEDVRGIDPKTRVAWFHAPRMRARINLLSLAVQRQLAFRLEATLTTPCETNLVISGRYRIQDPQLIADAHTSDIAVESIVSALAQRVPALKAGTLRATLHVSWQRGYEPIMVVHLTGTTLIWEDGTIRLTGNAVVEGTATPTPRDSRPWAADLAIRIDQGRVEGLPFLQQADEIAGALRLTDESLQITTLHGKTFGSPWQLEGIVEPLGEPRVDVRFRSHVDVAMAATHLLDQIQPWQPHGQAELVAVCRGPLARWSHHLALAAEGSSSPSPSPANPSQGKETGPLGQRQVVGWPDIELMAKVELREVSLLIPQLPHRLEHLIGHLEYDHLTKRLLIESLHGRIHDDPVTLEGSVTLTPPAVLHLRAQTTTDLGLWKEVLPHNSVIQSLAGRVVGQLALDGSVTHPTWQGEATLEDARLQVRGWPKPIAGLTGAIRFADDELSSSHLSFTIGDVPVLLAGTITALTASPQIACRVEASNSSLTLNGTLQSDRLLVDRSELSIGNSHVRVHGHVSRLPAQASHPTTCLSAEGGSTEPCGGSALGAEDRWWGQLTATGTVDLSDLSRIPWVHPKGLEAWRVEGTTVVQLRLLGPLDDWRSVEAAGFLRADQVAVRGIPLRTVSAELEQRQGKVAIRLTHATVADGRLAGAWLLQPYSDPARYLFEFDLTKADLAQLVPLIPAWSRRQIHGSASAHASFSGVWNDRMSLRGDGWVHAAGDRLAELPLIDRLFHGVFGALADRLGLASLRSAQLTKLAGQWRLSQERISTDDLRLSATAGTEAIVVGFRGSVGLDHTLDLIVEPELPEQLVLQAPNTSALGTAILKLVGGAEQLKRLVGRHHLGGTIDHPQYTFELRLDQLLNSLLSSGFGQLLDSVR